MGLLRRGVAALSGALGFAGQHRGDRGTVGEASATEGNARAPLLQDQSTAGCSASSDASLVSHVRSPHGSAAAVADPGPVSSATCQPASPGGASPSARAPGKHMDVLPCVSEHSPEAELANLHHECLRAAENLRSKRQDVENLRATFAQEEESASAMSRWVGEQEEEVAHLRCELQDVLQNPVSKRAEEVFERLAFTRYGHEIAVNDYDEWCSRASALASEITAWHTVQQHTHRALRSELDMCEASSHKARHEEHVEQLVCNDLQTACEAHVAEVDMRREAEAVCAREEEELADLVRELTTRARRNQDAYWSEAPFLTATVEEAETLRDEVVHNRTAAAELETAVESFESDWQSRARLAKQSPPSSLVGDLSASLIACNASSPCAAAPCDAPSKRPASPPPFPPATAVASAPRAVSAVVGPAIVAQLPPPPSSALAARTALEAENLRLHQRIGELRDQSAEMQLGSTEGAGPLPPSTDDTEHDGPLDAFDAAVAGTGARVVDWMKQALHEDVRILREFHAKKQQLDDDYRKERRLRVALERKLVGVVGVGSDANSLSR